MNEADSREMGQHLAKQGFSAAPSLEEADLALLNTCTVRQHAEDKALSYVGRLKDWKKKREQRMIIVTGCAAERLQKSLKHRFPHIDLIIGAKNIDQFNPIIQKHFRRYRYDWMKESENLFGNGSLRTEGDPFILGTEKQTAFVTIMRGCNYSCSYCIVPSVRGREIYRPIQKILQDIQTQVQQGSTHLLLLGQTVNSYWYKEPSKNETPQLYDFSDLLQEVVKISGLQEIRFMSAHPHYMNDKLIHTLSQSKIFTPEIHLPVQSGSNRILNLMKRNYTREKYIDIARKLKLSIPKLKLSTDLIVGFPTETEADFSETLSLVDEIGFSLAYSFKYSPRQGTESFSMNDDISTELKEERLAKLLEKIESLKIQRASLHA